MIDSAWYADSGASSHVTSDLGKLSTYSTYVGIEKLAVGSGEQLDITNNGNMSINSHTKSKCALHLKNVLHVPHIAKNLLSISRFTHDNNAVAEFCDGYCVIKDKVSKKTLLKGILRDGLYKLDLKADITSVGGSSHDAMFSVSNIFLSSCNNK